MGALGAELNATKVMRLDPNACGIKVPVSRNRSTALLVCLACAVLLASSTGEEHVGYSELTCGAQHARMSALTPDESAYCIACELLDIMRVYMLLMPH